MDAPMSSYEDETGVKLIIMIIIIYTSSLYTSYKPLQTLLAFLWRALSSVFLVKKPRGANFSSYALVFNYSILLQTTLR